MNINLFIFFIFLFLGVNAESLRSIINSTDHPKVSEDGKLDLSNLKLRNLKDIEHYPGIKEVCELILRDNNISTLEHLADVHMSLRLLDLGNNKISNVDVLKNFPNLEKIYLDSNNLNDEALSILFSLKKLNYLIIDNNPLKDPVYWFNFVLNGRRNINYFQMTKPEDESKKKREHTEECKEINEICAICHEQFKGEITKTKCEHIFHTICLNPWLIIKKTCPICRAVIED